MKFFPSPHKRQLPGNLAWLRRFLSGMVFAALLLSLFLATGQARVDASHLYQESPLLTVVINEISWGGTTADGSAGQWIELYNPGSTAENIIGWTLAADDGIPVIVLNGTIPAKSYFLLARRSDVFSSVTVDQVFLDPLQASGETLRLYNNSGQLVDTANISGGPWPAGRGFPNYASMERNSNAP
jgi:hypothetical protein